MHRVYRVCSPKLINISKLGNLFQKRKLKNFKEEKLSNNKRCDELLLQVGICLNSSYSLLPIHKSTKHNLALMSSLSAQLAQVATNNATVALDRKKRQKLHSTSLIYNPKTAATQDYELIFDNATKALDDLIDIEPKFAVFTKSLFSEASLSIDRNVQTAEENKDLDNAVNAYLMLASSKWHLAPTLHATEWLVRRFQINIVNAEMLLLSTLNYYQTPVFSRILNIVKLPPLFAPLSNFIRSDKLPTNLTIIKLFNDMAFLKFYVNFISKCVKQNVTYTNQLLFTTCCFINLIAFNSNNEDKLNLLVPILLEVSAKLLGSNSTDCQIAAHTILVVFATALPLKKVIILAATETILSNLKSDEAKKSALITICKLFQTLRGQGNIDQLPIKLYKIIDKRFPLEYLVDFLKENDTIPADKFITTYIRAIARYDHEKLTSIVKVLKAIKLEKFEVRYLINDLINLSEILESKTQLAEVFEYFISINEKLVLSCLKSLNITPEIFEIRLTTALFTKHDDSADALKDFEVEKVVGKASDIPLFKEFLDKNSAHIYTENKSLLAEADATFIRLLSLFVEAVGRKYSPGQFLTTFLTTLEARITFLTRITISPSAPTALKLIALDSIGKYLHNIDKESNVFTLVPCLIVALSDVSQNVRAKVRQLLSQISNRPSSKHYFLSKKIYGDDITLPLLSPKDSAHWLKKFLEDYVVDNYEISGLLIPKKNSKVYILFWANQTLQIPLPYAKLVLLNNLEKAKISQGSFTQIFEPIISKYIENRSSWEQRCKLNKTNFASFEKALVNLISSKEKNQFMLDFILNGLQSEHEALADTISEKLIIVFDSLKASQQLQIVQSILDTTVESEPSYDSIGLLQSLPLSSEIFNVILSQNRINSDDGAKALPKKRRRLSSATKSAFQKEEVTVLAEAHLRKITIVLETLDKSSISCTTELLSSLFVLLSDLETLDQDGGLPVLYAQETLTSCLLNAIESMKKSGTTELKNIRADILVSAIRNSSSPQLQNKLLLVVGALASLNSEIILHSIMPIFTFMGAHSIRQDDSYTIQVVEKTIKTVVPALLNNQGTDTADEAEILLMSFTTALQHVPKHRRVTLFSTLLEALGSSTSIGPFLFLVSQQYSGCLDGFKLGEAKSLVEFTKSLLTHFEIADQLSGIRDLLQLIAKLLKTTRDNGLKTELGSTTLFSNDIIAKPLAELIVFVQHTFAYINKVIKDDDTDYFNINGTFSLRVHTALLDKNSESEVSDLVKNNFSAILEQILTFIKDSKSYNLTGKTNSDVSSDQTSDVNSDLFAMLNTVLTMLPINDFIESTLPLLANSPNRDIRYQISLVIGDKFEAESIDSAPAASKVIKTLLTKIPEESSSPDLAQVMLNTLSGLISKFNSSLDDKLVARTITLAIGQLDSEFNEIVVSSLTVINNCIQVMGVKSISYYAKIVPTSIQLFNKLKKSTDSMKHAMQISILLLMATLLRVIPSFITSNLSDVFDIILFSDEVDVPTRLSVIELVVKHIDLKEVLKVLYKTWPQISTTSDSVTISLFLSSLEATVEVIDKKSATSQSPIFFRLLLALFEYRSISEFDNNTISRIEATVYQTANAYVLKMNDKVFRPLFVILVKWAFDGEGSNNTKMTEVERLIAFFKFFNKLQENLRGIITSYFTYLLEPTNNLLRKFINKDINDINLHRLLLNSLVSSFKYDKDEYWKSTSRFELICEPLINQLTVIENPIGKYLVKAISSLASNNNGVEEHNQIMNKLLAEHMKATCSSKEKLWAVRSVKLIYSKVGESWLLLLPQLVPTIAELLEDEDEEVEHEVRTGLVRVVENVLGEPFDRYLD